MHFPGTASNFFIFFQKKKFFSYFEKWNFLVPSLRKFLHFPKNSFSYILVIFSQEKAFLLFWEMELFIFQEETFQAQKLKKKTNHSEKNFLYFGKWNYLAQKNLIKLFYALNKTPLGKTGCLNNLYYPVF